jgi:hypothetical protein
MTRILSHDKSQMYHLHPDIWFVRVATCRATRPSSCKIFVAQRISAREFSPYSFNFPRRALAVNWNKVVAKKNENTTQEPLSEYNAAPPPPPPPPGPAQPPNQIVPLTPYEIAPLDARARLEAILSEPYLAVQRRLELANLLIGFEQANHYTLYNRFGQVKVCRVCRVWR